ncbi:MAG: phosphoribosylformylglycinamidine cyclo-ligase [Deltaproteobacteria bacterium RIFCSPLOWO2_02_FULL_46_8]|nr:MAG: phosphoribosylformylglycinamidine cyclo-ligase [Deltaproteobacteria bacterium RIFCSPLOWO2_02_FULL_46_8]
MALACQQVGCTLLGGETAEMPGVYPDAEWDCAGFSVGVIEKEFLIDGKKIIPGDVVLGVASSGFHSNGFSLIRKIIESKKIDLQMKCSETGLSLGERLLTPTKLYTPLILHLRKSIAIKGIAHITGGGLIENTPRILPEGCQIELKAKSWPVPAIMDLFREKGELSADEFYRVFNAGIGLVFIVSAKEQEKFLKEIQAFGEKAWVIGNVVAGETKCRIQS